MQADANRPSVAPPRTLAAHNGAVVRGNSAPRFSRALAISLIFALLYFGSARLGFMLASETKQVTAVWPPTGIAIVGLLLFRRAALPGILLGAFTVNLVMEEHWSTAAGIALGNTAGPWLAAVLLTRIDGFDITLSRVRDVFALVVFGAMGGMLITATNGVCQLALAGIVPWSAFLSVWSVWWVGDAMGVLVVAPFMLGWFAQPNVGWRGVRLLEYVLMFAALCTMNSLLFFNTLQLTYAVVPFAVWAALRFGPRDTATVLLVIASAAVWGVLHERGPFSLGPQELQLTFLALFLGVMSITALVLSAAEAQRERAEHALLDAQAELESRVEARTLELATANGTLQRANAELARQGQLIHAKNEEVEAFVYVVSHDLRAPLVNLRGFSEELRGSCRDLRERLRRSELSPTTMSDVDQIMKEGVDESLRYITASSGKLQRLIDALLVLSRTGREEYNLEPLDVQLLVRSSLDVLRQTIERSGAKIVVSELPEALGDMTAIGQVFGNLIGNALNYLQPGRPGRIEIGGEAEREMCHFWIKDNGVGIDTAAQSRVFQVFQRFHPELASGEGMGLAIVKRVVERHGGKAWAESQAGVGTTFHVTLPSVHGRRTGSWRKTA